jgi:hypothetical protein
MRVSSEMDRQALEREFDFLMVKHGIVVPAERRDGALSAFLELRRMAALLRNSRDASSEPAYIFSLPAVLRGR